VLWPLKREKVLQFDENPMRISILQKLAFATAGAATISLVGGSVQPMYAALITGVTATTDMGTFNNGLYSLENLTNGSGLSSLSETATHNDDFSNMWISNTDTTTGTVTFNLGNLYSVNSAFVWNYNADCCGLDRGVREMTIETSENGITFNSLLGSVILSQGTGEPISSDVFNLGNVITRYVRFNILSNYGAPDYTGLSEVQFEGELASIPTPVPEPETGISLLGLGAVALASLLRKKIGIHSVAIKSISLLRRN
jgi:hypothetical protein